MSDFWRAITREAGLAAENLAIGATALGKANCAEHAYYGQAFFALSIGLERSAKLALVIDHALENKGTFPEHYVLRSYGHNLKELLQNLDKIAERRGFVDRLPQEQIHKSIIEVLSDFASNITRYYNLDLITGDTRTANRTDPIEAWFKNVTEPILEKHYSAKQHKKHGQNAEIINNLIGGFTLVRHHSEEGADLNNVYDASLQTAKVDQSKPYTRMYVMQLFRFIACLMSGLTCESYRRQIEIPHMSDFFAIFNNDDKVFKTRKTWSIYRP